MKRVILMAIFFIFLKAKSQNSIPIKVLTNPDKFAYFDTLLNEFNTSWVFDYAEPFNKFGFARIKTKNRFGYINTDFFLVAPLYSSSIDVLKAQNDTIIFAKFTFVYKNNKFICNELSNENLFENLHWQSKSITFFKKPDKNSIVKDLEKVKNNFRFLDTSTLKLFKKSNEYTNTVSNTIAYQETPRKLSINHATENLNDIGLMVISTLKRNNVVGMNGFYVDYNSYLFVKPNPCNEVYNCVGLHIGHSNINYYLQNTRKLLKYNLTNVGVTYKVYFKNVFLNIFTSLGIGVFNNVKEKINDKTFKYKLTNYPLVGQLGVNLFLTNKLLLSFSCTNMQYSKTILETDKRFFNSSPLLIGLKTIF